MTKFATCSAHTVLNFKSISPEHLEASSKRLLGTPEDIPADERATEFEKRFVNVSAPIEASA